MTDRLAMTRSVSASTVSSIKAMSREAAIGSFLIIFAAKLLLIGHYGSPVPHWLASADDLVIAVVPVFLGIGMLLFANSVMIALRGAGCQLDAEDRSNKPVATFSRNAVPRTGIS
jgi:hypothetical protein